ncbi:2Fe-2S iron-sulfur cluster-binding protein [Pseudoalteromonas piscicida]
MQLPIRSSCRRGLCGSCSVVLVKGTLDDVCSVVEDGKVYSCKSYLLSDAEIHIKYT